MLFARSGRLVSACFTAFNHEHYDGEKRGECQKKDSKRPRDSSAHWALNPGSYIKDSARSSSFSG